MKDSSVLLDRLDKFLLEENEANKRPQTNIHPSSFGGCLRKVAYGLYGIEGKPRDARFLRICKNGNYVHERLQLECEEAPNIDVIGIEVLVYNPEYKIKGYIDGIISIDSKPYVLEIKSKNNKGFTQYLKKPEKNHIVQANIYLWLIEETIKSLQDIPQSDWDEHQQLLASLEGNIPTEAIFLYENKDNQEQKEFIVKGSDTVVEWVKSRASLLWKAIDSQKLPPRDYVLEDEDVRLPNECQYMCDYKDVCWSK